MARKRVFIASAGEDREMAQTIAHALNNSDEFEAVTWWGHTFTAGGFTLDQLIAKAQNVDAAVILFSAIDSVEVRNVRGLAPRDNCLIEYGLFAASVGRARTIVVASPNVRIPSDLLGITYERWSDPVTTAGQVVDLLKKAFQQQPVISQSTPIVAEQQLAMYALRSGMPEDWRMRQLFFSHSGAAAWIETSRDPNYLPADRDNWLSKQVDVAIQHVNPMTFVSLGPGSCDTDEAIISALQLLEPWLRYVPIDISVPLLMRAVHKFKDRVLMPLAINADFEANWNFIHTQLENKAPRPYLLTILGNTLGNLDTNEATVMSAMVSKMQPSDTLLLDVALAGEAWSIDKDPRGRHDAYTPRFRAWLANSLAERADIAREQVLHDFERRFEFTEASTGRIPGTRSIEVRATDNEGDRLRILTIRRYHLESLKKWFSEFLKLETVYEASTYYEDGVSGDAVFVLRRRR